MAQIIEFYVPSSSENANEVDPVGATWEGDPVRLTKQESKKSA